MSDSQPVPQIPTPSKPEDLPTVTAPNIAPPANVPTTPPTVLATTASPAADTIPPAQTSTPAVPPTPLPPPVAPPAAPPPPAAPATSTAPPVAPTPIVPPPVAPAPPIPAPAIVTVPPTPEPAATTPTAPATPDAPASPTEQAAPEDHSAEEPVPDTAALYLFGEPKNDHDRLVAQAYLFSQFVRENGPRFIRQRVSRILDIGCSDGRLTIVLSKLYPNAKIVGFDIDAQAIERAKVLQTQLPGGSPNIEYIVGNAQETLPDGPFDLIYMGMIALHLTEPQKVLRHVYDLLSPNGYIWVKELHPNTAHGLANNPAWEQVVELLRVTMDKAGRKLFRGGDMRALLEEAGFANIRVADEIYPMNNHTTVGRITIGSQLGVFMNARKLIAKMTDTPEEEVIRLTKILLDQADTMNGKMYFVDFVAQRPAP